MPRSQNATPTVASYAGGHFEVNERGVFFHGAPKDGAKPSVQWICSTLRVTAQTRDEHSASWGRFLEWKDDDGKAQQWAIPLEMLEGDTVEVRKELARRGLSIAPGRSRDLLAAYIKVWPTDRRMRCVQRLGWHGSSYVTPYDSYGDTDEAFAYQNAQALDRTQETAGTADEWRDTVGRLAVGNSRLIFAISIALAGPLLHLAREDSGGFHIRGTSSCGKSTALKLAASVWGSPAEYIRLWRTTTNGLEGLACQHSDNVLILDELSQIDPNAVGEAAYLLANGQGKTRATKYGTARPANQWRLLFLSAGEESLLSLASQARRRSTAGQELRLADIEADAGAGRGLFENLHDSPDAAHFAQRLKSAAQRNFGSIGRQWLQQITANHREFVDTVASRITAIADTLAPVDSSGQIQRVARRFAIAAVAGELASEAGLTGWESGEAQRAASTCFTSWLRNFGGSDLLEERAIISHVKEYIALHGASRFENLAAVSDQTVINRVGYYRDRPDGSREFLFLPATFKKEICEGFDEKTVRKALRKAGLLVPAANGGSAQVARLPGLGKTCRVIVLTYDAPAHDSTV